MTRLFISALLGLLTCTLLHGQVINAIGNENLKVPQGMQPRPTTPKQPVDVWADMDTASVYYHMMDSAQVHIDRHEWEQAEQCLRRAIVSDPVNPNNALLLSNIATMQRYRGLFAQAAKNYTLSLDIAPNSVTVLLNRAALYVQMDSVRLAERDYRRVRDLDPYDTESRYSLGMLAVDRQDFKQAEDYFNEIRRINPNSGLYSEGMGMLHKANGNYARAAGFLSEVIKVRPNAKLLANRADCYLTMKRLNDAEEDIRNALAETPDDGYLYVLRAKLNKLRFNYRDMETDLQLAVQHGVDKEIVKSLLK